MWRELAIRVIESHPGASGCEAFLEGGVCRLDLVVEVVDPKSRGSGVSFWLERGDNSD